MLFYICSLVKILASFLHIYSTYICFDQNLFLYTALFFEYMSHPRGSLLKTRLILFYQKAMIQRQTWCHNYCMYIYSRVVVQLREQSPSSSPRVAWVNHSTHQHFQGLTFWSLVGLSVIHGGDGRLPRVICIYGFPQFYGL